MIDTKEDHPEEKSTVSVISKTTCEPNSVCYRISVSCLGNNPENASLRVYQPEQSKGMVIFTSEHAGTTFYGGPLLNRTANNDVKNSADIVLSVREAGFETVEIKWHGQFGWVNNNPGVGLNESMCVYAEVVKWLQKNVANNKNVMCATGNSAGSMQIGHSLALHNLEEVLDLAVLTGGPPTSSSVNICYPEYPGKMKRNEQKWSGVGGVLALMDHVMGWYNNGDYCEWAEGPEFTVEALDRTSIVSTYDDEVRDYNYPNTVVAFVEGGDDYRNIPRAQKYFDAITTQKSWTVLEGVSHGVHRVEKGARAIKEELLARCYDRATIRP